MTQQPHQTPAFAHAAEFTIVLTFVVAGGKRPRTAHRRGDRVLERIADYTARLAQVVEVTAVGRPTKTPWTGPNRSGNQSRTAV